MKGAALLGAALSGLVGGGAAAQSFEEAVRANTQLATNLCIQVMIQRTAPRDAFEGAGFGYRSIDRGVNDYGVALGFDHYFEAPASTAKAEVDDPGAAGLCMVMTTHLAEADLAQIVAAELFRDYPGAEVRSETEWSVATPSGLPLIVSTDTIGTNHRYEEPGTVRVTMSYPG